MKKIALFMVALVAVILTGCMDQHDVPNVEVYGNPSVPEANTTIANLKKQFKSITASSGVQQIEDSIIISGVIVADDESGNVYKHSGNRNRHQHHRYLFQTSCGTKNRSKLQGTLHRRLRCHGPVGNSVSGQNRTYV